MTIIYAVIIFCIMIFPHELGHFVAAKSLKVQVNEFALGMGPTIFKRQKGETQYSLRLFPIGGFCAMEGEDDESENPRAFNNKPAWSRAIILAAGSFMNVMIALIILIIISLVSGTATTVVDQVQESSPAYEAGIQQGDRILSIDGTKINKWEDITTAIGSTDKKTLSVDVERNGREMTIDTTVMKNDEGRKIIGIVPGRSHNPGMAVISGAKATWQMTVMMGSVIKQLFTGDVSTKELTGPVGIVYTVGDMAKKGFSYLAYLTALISLNLAVVNMLPLPALDGGRLLFLLIRKITGKAITDELEGKIHFVGIMLLFGLMIYVTWNDIFRFIVPSFN